MIVLQFNRALVVGLGLRVFLLVLTGLPQAKVTLRIASGDIDLLADYLDDAIVPPEIHVSISDLTANALGVRINLENLSEAAPDLKIALEAVPGLGMTLDVGHAMLTRRVSTAPEIVRQLSDRISHLHLHDNHGGKSHKDDLHLIPGEGKVAFAELFRMLKERGFDRTATLELAPHEMELARKRVTDLWVKA